jgi:hypothetical protein
MAAIDTAWVSKILNASLPVGVTAANPGVQVTALTAAAMMIALTSTDNSAGAGSQLANGNGYVTNGKSFTASGSTSSAGSSVSLPAAGDASTFLWTNTSGGWTIYGLNITSSTQVRTFFGNFNGAPITIAALNSFQIAQSAITVSLT